jgi:hypothetical protein
MSDVPDINNPIEWGKTWRKPTHCTIKSGDVFMLDLYGDGAGDVYRAVHDWDDSSGGILLKLEKCYWHTNGTVEWESEHAWDMRSDKTLIKFWKQDTWTVYPKINPMPYDICSWQAWAHNKPTDCPCGIIRSDCDYHK